MESFKKKQTDLKKTWKVIRRTFSEAYKADPLSLQIGVLLSIVLGMIPTLSRFVDSRVIDQILESVSDNLTLWESDQLLKLIGLSICISIIQKALWAVSTYIEKLNYFAFQKYFTFEYYKKASGLGIAEYEDKETGDLIEKAREASDWRMRESTMDLIWAIYDLTLFTVSLIVVLSFSPLLFLLIIATVLPFIIGRLKLGKSVWGIWDANSTTRRRFWWTLGNLNSPIAIKEIKINGSREYFLDFTSDLYDSFVGKERKSALNRIGFEAVLGNISTIGIMAFWVYSINSVIGGDITIGDLSFYTGAAYGLTDGMNKLVRRFTRLFEGTLYLENYFEFLDLDESLIAGDKEIEPGAVTIEFKNVWFKYPKTKKYVLKNLNFKINSSDKIAFVGINGAGKTTVIKLICRFYDVTKGEILINGVNIKDISIESLYRAIGILFQDFLTMGQFSVKQNIEIGDISSAGDEKMLEDAVHKADAKDFIDEYEYKMEQVLDKSFDKGTSPSGGQWQRIGIARTFFKDASLLILDEPTSAIDAKAEATIFDRIFEFAKNKTVIIISHRFSTVRQATRILVLKDGEIVEDGSHDELMKVDGIYAESFKLQAKGYQ